MDKNFILDVILAKEIVHPVCYILIGVCVYFMISQILKRTYYHQTKGVDDRKKKTIISLINNVIKYVIAVIVILMILEVYDVNTSAILASLGVAGLVVGLALQDLIKDFVAGVFIVFDDQYSVGDNVKINDFRGDVIGVGLKSTKVKAYTGEVMIIANGTIQEVINYSASDSLAIIDVDVSYQEDLDRIMQVLEQLCKEKSKEFSHLREPFQVLGVMDLGDSGIQIRITGVTDPMNHFEVEREMRKEIKKVFDKEKIEIPYPQVVVHNGKKL